MGPHADFFSRVRAAALCVLGGLLQAWSLALPGSGDPSAIMQLAGMGLLMHQLQQAHDGRQAAARVWLFATVWLSATFWWLFTALHVYGGLPMGLAVAAVVALAAALGFYHALAGACFVWLKPAHPLAQAVLWGALWMMAELARSVWFTGFGWGGIAYAHIDGWLVAWAPWLGAHGMHALLASFCMGLYLTLSQLIFKAKAKDNSTFPTWVSAQRRSSWALVFFLVVCLAPGIRSLWVEPTGWTQSTGEASVTLLQGNIAQDEKFEPGSGVPDALDWYGQQLQAAKADVTIAPETAIPLLPAQLPAAYWQSLQQRFASGTQAALLGIPMGDFTRGYTNSVIGLSPAASYRYDKHHLVPFGEFIPPWFRWFTELMHIPLGDFERGGLNQPAMDWAGQRWGINICFEDLFGEELAQRFAGDDGPTVFVNVSNIAWFGQSQAPDQHLAISRLRALEFERPFVRATNTGMTAVINHRGQVLAQLPRFTRATLHATVQGRQGTTAYVRWVSQWGLWPLWAWGLLVVAVCYHRRKRPEAP